MTKTVLRGTALALASAALAVLPAVPAQADALRAQEWALQAVHAQQAWRTTKGEGITVAVLDTGVDANHPDLIGQVLPEQDLVGFGAGSGDAAWARHGTGMASIIAGHGHGDGREDGVLGLAPAARILPVRVILEDSDPQRERARSEKAGALADGIRWAADHGADVINMSLGDDSESAHPEPREDAAIQYALGKGIPVVASAATAARRATTSPTRPPTRASSRPPPSPIWAAAPAFPPATGTPRSAPPASTSSWPTPTTATSRAGAPAPPPPSSPAPSP